MHASIAVCVMMVGGWIGPPALETETYVIPLREDLALSRSFQDLEWKERLKSTALPRVPTVDDRKQGGDDSRSRRSTYPPVAPTDPRAAQPRQGMLPQPPTSADRSLANQPMSSLPLLPGGGGGGGGGYQSAGPGGYTAPVTSKSDPYANLQMMGPNPVQGYSNQFGAVPAPRSLATSNFTSNLSVDAYTRQFGLSNQNTTSSPAGGGAKPFSDYRAQNGFTPWQYLNQPTQNGTVSPYSAYVRPTLDQQNFNSHVSEQINGVQTQQRYGAATPGMEVPLGGAGLVNPQIFNNYR
jgi:hypothetical protein